MGDPQTVQSEERTRVTLTLPDAQTVQRALIDDGSALAEIGSCGHDLLPCGVCDECIDQHSDESWCAMVAMVERQTGLDIRGVRRAP